MTNKLKITKIQEDFDQEAKIRRISYYVLGTCLVASAVLLSYALSTEKDLLSHKDLDEFSQELAADVREDSELQKMVAELGEDLSDSP